MMRTLSSLRSSLSAPEQLRRLADLMPQDAEPDSYGGGERIRELEDLTASLLGKPAALFAASGKALQNSVLRVHADRRARPVVVAHTRSHIVEDELGALEALYGLRVIRLGSPIAPFGVAELNAITDEIAAVSVELPLRRAGFLLTAFDELVAMRDAVHARGAAFHLDGARLWECAPAYERSLGEIASLFDSVYVSFYKGLQALSGAALGSDRATVRAVDTWLARCGVRLPSAFPFVEGALTGLATELPRMPLYFSRARVIAELTHDIDGLWAMPDPPHANSFVIHVAAPAEALVRARDRVAEEHGITCFRTALADGDGRSSSFEVVVGPATMQLDHEEIRAALRVLAHFATRTEPSA